MQIQIDPHTLERAEERGTNEKEIVDIISIRDFLSQLNMGILGKLKYMISSGNDMVSTMNKKGLKYFILSKKI